MDIQKDDRKACGKEQTGDRDWKVTFEGGFYGQRGRRGIEIPVGKTFSWGKEIWHVPAVYQCGKGLVADIFAEIDPERVKAFLERYRDLEEDRLTEEEQERIQQESPLCLSCNYHTVITKVLDPVVHHLVICCRFMPYIN